jgi:hypothetical protein
MHRRRPAVPLRVPAEKLTPDVRSRELDRRLELFYRSVLAG